MESVLSQRKHRLVRPPLRPTAYVPDTNFFISPGKRSDLLTDRTPTPPETLTARVVTLPSPRQRPRVALDSPTPMPTTTMNLPGPEENCRNADVGRSIERNTFSHFFRAEAPGPHPPLSSTSSPVLVSEQMIRRMFKSDFDSKPRAEFRTFSGHLDTAKKPRRLGDAARSNAAFRTQSLPHIRDTRRTKSGSEMDRIKCIISKLDEKFNVTPDL